MVRDQPTISPSTMPNATASAKPAMVVHSVTSEWRSSGRQYCAHGARRSADGAGRMNWSILKMRQTASQMTNRPMVNSQGDELLVSVMPVHACAHLGDLGAQLVHDVGEVRLVADLEVARPRQVDRLGHARCGRAARS